MDLINCKKNECSLFSFNGMNCYGKVCDVYDGDTCKIIMEYNKNFHIFNCRLLGIDTKEIKLKKDVIEKNNLKNDDEKTKYKNDAINARNYLIQQLTNIEYNKEKNYDKNTKIIFVECYNFDKYGRLLVKLYDSKNKKICFNDDMILNNYAIKY